MLKRTEIPRKIMEREFLDCMSQIPTKFQEIMRAAVRDD